MKINKRKWLAGLAVLLILSAIMAAFWFSSRNSAAGEAPDRMVRGKLISTWVKEALRTDDYHASELLKPLGAEVIPFLTPVLKEPDSKFNSFYVQHWTNIPPLLQRGLTRPLLARDQRMRVVVILREMGPPAIGAVPDLITTLADTDPTIRLHSAITLGNVGPGASNALPYLEPLLTNKAHVVRVYTANAVWKITGKPELVLPVLEKGVDEKAAYRWSAVVFLGELGPAAASTIPLLEKLTSDEDKEVASLAVQSLAAIGPETVSILTNVLNDPDPRMRVSAATALGKLGPQAKAAIPALLKFKEDRAEGAPIIMGRGMGAEQVGHSAVEALKLIDPEALKDVK